MIHTVKGFSTANHELDIFLKLTCFLYDPINVGNLIAGSSSFSKLSLYIWKFSVHILLKPILKHFEHNFTSSKMSAIVYVLSELTYPLVTAGTVPQVCKSLGPQKCFIFLNQEEN